MPAMPRFLTIFTSRSFAPLKAVLEGLTVTNFVRTGKDKAADAAMASSNKWRSAVTNAL